LSQLDSLSIGISPLNSPLENSSAMDKFNLEFIVLLATLDFVFEFCFSRSVKLLWKSSDVLLDVPDFDLFIISSVSADEAETFPSWSSEFLDKDSVILFTCFDTSLTFLALIELDILLAATAVLSFEFISFNILLLRVCNFCLLFNLTLADVNCAVPKTQLLSVSFSELKFVFSSDRNLSDNGVKRLHKKVLPKNSIMVTCIGTVGKVAVNSIPVITNQQINTIVPNNDIVDNNFLYYRLVSTYEILKLYGSDGTVVPIINKNNFENLKTIIPEIQEQKAIAEVLSSLDDKIDLLHQQNKTLENLAQTLFRQWFVEEAKDDWEKKPLKEVVDIGIGRTPPRKEFHWFSKNTKDIKWVSIKDMGECGVFTFDTSEYLTSEAVQKFNVPIIPVDTVLLSFKMTLGRVKITTEKMLSNEAIAHFKFNNTTPFSKEYLYFFLKAYPYQTLGSTSSIVTSINSTIIKEMLIPIPNKKIINEFIKITKPKFNKIYSNQQQIKTLENTRDTLLPKLMSGEVGVEI